MRSWGTLTFAAVAITFGASLAMPDVAVAEEGVVCGNYQENRKITRAEILSRSRTWLSARVPYSQADCYENPYGSYRTDCSGYLSMVWGLRSSYTTHVLEQVAHQIDWADLRPGDALNDRENHVALFIGWADAGRTRPMVREQAGPNGSRPVQRVWSAATAKRYTPLRYNNVIDTAVTPPVAPVAPAEPEFQLPVAGAQVANTATKAMEVFARSEDGTLLQNSHRTSRWHGWTELGAERFAGEPAALHNPESKAVEVFARTTDGRLLHRSGDETWQQVGEQLTGDPVALWNPATKSVEVFARGADNRLLHNQHGQGGWSGWTALGDRELAGAPSVVYNPAAQTVDVFARSADRLVHASRKDGAAWTPWEVRGEQAVTSDPSAVHHVAAKSVEVFARGADGAVAHVSSDDWAAWKSLGGKIKDAPSVVYHPGTNSINVVAWSESGFVERTHHDGAAWQPWVRLDDRRVSKAPAAVYQEQTKSLLVFARSVDGKLIRKFHKERAGWSSWAAVGDRVIAP